MQMCNSEFPVHLTCMPVRKQQHLDKIYVNTEKIMQFIMKGLGPEIKLGS